ncbi:hypothetical protein HOB87_02075 [Candidatus Woesearchaeota archaeon]|jgi:hypothetical protein|nr:hypothetical protein [Candidatus Woesearchaeota archaeon]
MITMKAWGFVGYRNIMDRLHLSPTYNSLGLDVKMSKMIDIEGVHVTIAMGSVYINFRSDKELAWYKLKWG